MYGKKIEATLLEGRARVVRLQPLKRLMEGAEHRDGENQMSTEEPANKRENTVNRTSTKECAVIDGQKVD